MGAGSTSLKSPATPGCLRLRSVGRRSLRRCCRSRHHNRSRCGTQRSGGVRYKPSSIGCQKKRDPLGCATRHSHECRPKLGAKPHGKPGEASDELFIRADEKKIELSGVERKVERGEPILISQ